MRIRKGLIGICLAGCLLGCGKSTEKDVKAPENGTVVTEAPADEQVSDTTGDSTEGDASSSAGGTSEGTVPEATSTPAPTATPKPTATPIPTPYVDEVYWQGVVDSFSDSKYDLTEALMCPALKDWCKGYFKLGVGLTGSSASNMAIHSPEYMTVAGKHFNSVTLTNLMKPSYLLNQEGSMKNSAEGNEAPAVDFSGVTEVLQWCMDNGVQMRGHTLVWHTQTPDWYFREGYKSNGAYVDRETMLFRLDSYIEQVLTFCQDNYPGVLYCWDVVNEAVDPDLGDENSFFRCRTQNDGTPNPWYVVVGEDYVEQAFRSARKYAAEDVKLFYNDFNTFYTAKNNCIYKLCEYLAAEGLIDGIGMQGYWTGVSASNVERAIKNFAKLGLEIQITELTVDAEDLSEAQLKKQANSYGNFFYTLSYLDTQGGGPANITSVTLFGLQDGFVMYGGSDKTTSRIFDTNFKKKLAFERIERIMSINYKNREE